MVVLSFVFAVPFQFGFEIPQASAVDGEITYTGTNTEIYGDDGHQGGAKGPFGFGFDFDFYGTTYDQAWANINGTLNFDSLYTTYSNQQLSGGADDNAIYPFWDDLTTQGVSNPTYKTIYYATIGEEGSRKFVMQWTNMYFYGTSITMGTFQVILYEGSNNIRLQYRDLLGARSGGASATIGIRKNATTYEQHSYGTNNSGTDEFITEEQSILYSPNGVDDYTVDTGASYDPIYLLPDGVPTSPQLINPTDGTTDITVTPTFEWLPVEGATSYRLLISTVDDFSTTVVNQNGITDTTYTLGSDLGLSTDYYWRVEAINSNGSSFSSTRTFTTAAAANADPDTPASVASEKLLGGDSLTSAELESSTITMLLSDDDDDEQVRYRIQIATDDGFSNVVLDYRSTYSVEGGRTFTLGEESGTYLVGAADDELADDDYYVRIRTEDDGAGSSSWYTPGTVAFTVYNPPDITAPALSSIAADISGTTATVTWTSNEAGSSQVEYGLVSSYGWQTTEANTSPRVTSHSVEITDLHECARYYYRVKSADAASNTGTSSQKTFIVGGCPASSIVDGTEEVIDNSAGGNFQYDHDDYVARITAPANFASEQSRFQINRLQSSGLPARPENLRLFGSNVYDLLAVTDSNTAIDSFDNPVAFTVFYSDASVSAYDESTLDVYSYADGGWVKKNCDLSMALNFLTCNLSSFSLYAVMGELREEVEDGGSEGEGESGSELEDSGSSGSGEPSSGYSSAGSYFANALGPGVALAAEGEEEESETSETEQEESADTQEPAVILGGSADQDDGRQSEETEQESSNFIVWVVVLVAVVAGFFILLARKRRSEDGSQKEPPVHKR